MNGELTALVCMVREACSAVVAWNEQRAAGRAVSPGGEVTAAVDKHGGLVSLQLRPGTTRQIHYEVLESLINATIAEATRRAFSATLTQVS
ncbi:YbaB/EbfC family nucleoid-associated protein [Mycobacteroides abscessus]|uniref:YbaB/EbfC family nucleoid-associated protein n=1 Tax=Mycobacteroides abscessus TaxID=36809 RepID=UPI002107D883|nr:YbaB/EbfC family nucleoid-associated protein [Mycobacteroides abscessus]